MAISVSSAFKAALRGNVDLSQIKVEINFTGTMPFSGAPAVTGGSWVDVTPYVESISGTMEEVSPATGTASANTLTLSLINDDGRFSPKNTAGPYSGNLVPNKPIRVSVSYGGESVRVFTGFVSNWIPSAKARSCQVTAEDAARILRRKDLTEEVVYDSTAPATGYYLTRVLERAAYLSGWRWDKVVTKAAAWTNLDQNGDGANEITNYNSTALSVVGYDAAATQAYYYKTIGGTDVLVMTLDLVSLYLPVSALKGKALVELQRIADVAGGVLYFDAQGQLIFRCRMYRNDSVIASAETFTVASLEDVQTQVNFEDSRWSPIVNRCTVKGTPWAVKTNAAGTVVEEEVPFKGDLFGKVYFNSGAKFPDYTAGTPPDLYAEMPSNVRIITSSGYPAAQQLTIRSVLQSDTSKDSTGITWQGGYPVFEQSRIKLALINNGASAEQLKSITLRAKLVRPIQKIQSIQKNQASIDTYDQRDKDLTNDLVPTADAAKQLAAWHVEDGRSPKDVFVLPVMYGCPWLELGDRITLSETITNSVPSATDAIIRRLTWSWALGAYTYKLEAVSPSPAFSAGSIPATVANVETQNMNNRATNVAGDSHPAVVDSKPALVSLSNNVNLLAVTDQVKAIAPGSSVTFPGTLSFNGKDLYVGSEYVNTAGYQNHRIGRVDTMTGALGWYVDSVNATDLFADITTSGKWLFMVDVTNKSFQVKDTTAASAGTMTNKATLSQIPSQVFCVGSKTYVIARNTTTGNAEVLIWNAIDATVAAADSTVSLGSASAVACGRAGIHPDGTTLFVPVGNTKIAQFSISGGTLTSSDILGGGNAYTLNAVCHDGVNLWASWESGGAGYISLLQQTGATSYQFATTLPAFNRVRQLLFDGAYIWASSEPYVYQISTTNTLIAKFDTKSSYGTGAAEGRLAFDGFAIWVSQLDAANIYRVPRLYSGRQF